MSAEEEEEEEEHLDTINEFLDRHQPIDTR
jgi:hypothetical protein